jgi:hypothetical protein
MNQSNAVQCTKSIAQSRAEIHALFDAENQGGSVWGNLDSADKRIFCAVAGVEIRDLDKPLNRINQFDRRKLFSAIKSIEQVSRQFASVSFQDFK